MTTKPASGQNGKARRTNSRNMPRPPAEIDTSTFRGRFGAKLRELRQKKFGSTEEAAQAVQAMGIKATGRAWSHWEHGKRLPSLEDLPVIAEALGVSDYRKILPTESA